MDVSFLLCSQGSRLTPLQALQFYLWAEFPQVPYRDSKATHQLASPRHSLHVVRNKSFGNLILSTQPPRLLGEKRLAKRVILITGTPCVGKTSTARLLTSRLAASYVNLTELATRETLVLGKDEKRDTIIVDEKNMKERIRKIIEEGHKKDVVIDGHYAANVVPERLVSHVFVLRRDPVELRKLMEQRNFSEPKLWENLASEILDVCLVDALNVHGEGKVCELDASGKSPKEIVSEIMASLEDGKKCHVGIVDWIGKLESEGLLDEYLKI
jgi:adenylate kinase